MDYVVFTTLEFAVFVLIVIFISILGIIVTVGWMKSDERLHREKIRYENLKDKYFKLNEHCYKEGFMRDLKNDFEFRRKK